jgi:O-acetyl-ADP-ribose deacetylase (regulator of RNase III)
MKPPSKKKSVDIPRIEHDLKILLQSGEAFSDDFTDEPPRINIEGALEIFDRLRARESASAPKDNEKRWTHPSVLALDPTDPVSAILARARHLVLSSIERGWTGPPYNPLKLAELNEIRLLPTESVLDARTRWNDHDRHFIIEFNPQRPPARINYSIAHEIGHTLFKDCAAAIRNRATHEQMEEDEWQLETLCNMAASEILMPIGTLRGELAHPLSLGLVLELRKKYLASCEAVVNRFIRLTPKPCVAFFARREASTSHYSVEYALKSPAIKTKPRVGRGLRLPKESHAQACTNIGMTAREESRWIFPDGAPWYTEYLAISPNAGEVFPRVLCLASPVDCLAEPASGDIRYLRGDASEPVGTDSKILLQLTNDKAQVWGGGFAGQIRRKWPQAQQSFRQWTFDRSNLQLGNIHVFEVRQDLTLISVVGQHGFGKAASGPRVRYGAIFQALEKVAGEAGARSASVHMPRIGTGAAGGSWSVIEGIIRETLVANNIAVTVYDVNTGTGGQPQQGALDLPTGLIDEVV